MNKIITLLLSSVCLFATSCEIDVDYYYTTILTYKNNSSHIIEINANSTNPHEMMPWSCSINPGESYSHTDNSSGPGTIWYIMIMDGGVITFDNEITVDHHNTDIAHNLCDENSYTVEISGRHETECEYTYTFTDEDYDRAVAANAKEQ